MFKFTYCVFLRIVLGKSGKRHLEFCFCEQWVRFEQELCIEIPNCDTYSTGITKNEVKTTHCSELELFVTMTSFFDDVLVAVDIDEPAGGTAGGGGWMGMVVFGTSTLDLQ